MPIEMVKGWGMIFCSSTRTADSFRQRHGFVFARARHDQGEFFAAVTADHIHFAAIFGENIGQSF